MNLLARKIKKYLRVFLALRRLGVMSRMAYRVNFFIACVAVFLQMFFSVVFIRVIFNFSGNLAGWGYYQALVIVATYMIIEGLMWVLFAYLGTLSRFIREGMMDGLLVKPIDSQFLVSVWRGDAEDSTRLIVGAVLLFYALKNLSLSMNELLVNFPVYLILLVCAFIITYSLALATRTVSFWVIEANSLFQLSNTLTKLSQYPADIIYHKIVRLIFTVVIPMAFMATVPAKILAYGLNWPLVFSAVLIATIFFFFSRRFWLFALKHYSSASS